MKGLKKLTSVFLSFVMLIGTMLSYGFNHNISYADQTQSEDTLTLPLKIYDAHMDGFLFEYDDYRGKVFGEPDTGRATKGLVENTLVNGKMVYTDASNDPDAGKAGLKKLAENIKKALGKSYNSTNHPYPNLYYALKGQLGINPSVGTSPNTTIKSTHDFKDIQTCYDAAYWMTYYMFRDGGNFSGTYDNETYEGVLTQNFGIYDKLVLNKQSDGSYSFSATLDNEHVLYDTTNRLITNDTTSPTRGGFFPLDGLGFDKENPNGETHNNKNYAYTLESSGEFVYNSNENLYFSFKGDDDVYLFINDKLVLDIGGQHSQVSDTVYLNNIANDLGLKEGEIYDFNFFYMERHTTYANMEIKTNIRVEPKIDSQKNAYIEDTKIPDNGLVAAGSTINYEFVLSNTGNTNITDLTFVDNMLGVKLSSNEIKLNDLTNINEITVSIGNDTDGYTTESVTVDSLKNKLAQGIAKGQTIKIKGFKYKLDGSHNETITNIVSYTGKVGNKTLDGSVNNKVVIVKSSNTAFVIDFGKPVTYASNRVFSDSDLEAQSITLNNSQDNNSQGTYGNLTFNSDKSITYKLNKFMEGIDKFIFNVTFTKDTQNVDLQKSVSMVPASSIYYEDNFSDEKGNTLIHYGDGWSILGTDTIPGVAGDGNLGYDSAYDTSDSQLSYSGGTIHYVPKSTEVVRADFTFTGQGIDIYSYTSGATGKLAIRIYDKDENKVFSKTINTKYNSGKVYQTPVVTFMGEISQTYRVEILVPKNNAFYLDAVRIYNSVKVDKDDIGGVEVDNEADAKFVSIREESLNPTLFTVSGNVFIDKYANNDAKVVTIADSLSEYTTYGRKTEVVLAPNGSITITLNDSNKKYSKVELGARIDASVPSNITGGSEDGKLDVNGNPISLKSSTDMYYTVSFNDQGQLVITNNTNKLVALTKIKLID